MQLSFVTLLPFVALALSHAAEARDGIHDPYRYAKPIPKDQAYDVTWKQTRSRHIGWKQGDVNSSVKGMFPWASDQSIGMGCGLNWVDGNVGAGINGGDGKSGIGSGFNWGPDGITNSIGVSHAGKTIDLRLTINNDGEIIFKINNVEMDWNKLRKAQKGNGNHDINNWLPNDQTPGWSSEDPDKVRAINQKTYWSNWQPESKDAGPKQFTENVRPYALDQPTVRYAPERN